MVCILRLYFRGGTRNLLWEVPSKYTKMHIRELEYVPHRANVATGELASAKAVSEVHKNAHIMVYGL